MKLNNIAIFGLLLMAACTSKIDFEVKPPTPPVVNTDILISEISTAINTDPLAVGAITGGRNHYIELFNGTASSIDLSNYAIGYQASTDLATLSPWAFATGNFQVLTGNLAANACYVIASPQANTTAVPSNITWGTTSTTSANASMPLQLSGNSAIALLKRNSSGTIVLNGNNYSIIDVFGSPLVARETSSGTNSARNNFIWSIAGETDTRNRTFMRKKTVSMPTTDWSTAKGTNTTTSQWLVSVDRAWDYTNVGKPTP
jgi:Lamin Tail Domain